MQPHIRLATAADVPAILEISNHYARTTPANFAVEPEPLSMWQEMYRTTHIMHPWLVASTRPGADSAAEHIVGFTKSSPWKGRCAYTWAAEVTIYLAPGQAGKGLGKALYGRLFELLRAQGYRRFIGGVTLPNDASVRLHESFGFHRVALLEKVGWKDGRWWDVGYWELLVGDDDPPPHLLRSVGEAWDAAGAVA